MGALPALGGFLVLVILFSFLSQQFLTPLNMANLLTQSATLMTLAVALVFVILLGEIDLSAGVTSGVGAAIFVVMAHGGTNWIVALIVAGVVGLAIGTFIGFFVARVGIPSFVVTLGLFLGFPGPAAADHRTRRRVPHRDARDQRDHEPQPAGVARLDPVRRGHGHRDRHRGLRPIPSHPRRCRESPASADVGTPRGDRRRRRPVHPVPQRGSRPQPRVLERRADRARRDHRRADRRAVRPGDPLDRHLRARSHPVRPAPVRGRRQPRGGTACRHPGRRGPARGIRRLLGSRRRGGHLRCQPHRRRHRGIRFADRPVRCRRGGRRRASRCSADAAGSCTPRSARS